MLHVPFCTTIRIALVAGVMAVAYLMMWWSMRGQVHPFRSSVPPAVEAADFGTVPTRLRFHLLEADLASYHRARHDRHARHSAGSPPAYEDTIQSYNTLAASTPRALLEAHHLPLRLFEN